MLWEGDLETETIYNAPNPTAAEVIKSLLEGEGIRSVVIPFGSNYSGHPALRPVDGQGGWGLIVIRADQADMGRKIIQAYESASVSDEELAAQAEAAGRPEE